MKVVGIGGSTRAGSSTELLLRAILSSTEALGAETALVTGEELLLPPYEPGARLPDHGLRLVELAREADAVVIGSPGYHGGISGLVKNALDYLEELREDDVPYLAERPVGLAVTAYGWQAAVTTLTALRQIAHALRGWPTPLGIAVNVAATPLGGQGPPADAGLQGRIEQMARELVGFDRPHRVAPALHAGGRLAS
ncbi:MAG: NAD(P)H-dependent oxidoreductase [Actinobacteria bacterium]|nr:NAD(P)H-dependent oxidoreductase [Actinomycetota bacterium]